MFKQRRKALKITEMLYPLKPLCSRGFKLGGLEAFAFGFSRFKVEAYFQCDDMSIRKQGVDLTRVFVILNLILNLVQDDILTMEGSLCFP